MLFLEKLKQILFNEKIKSSKQIETEISLKTITEIPLRKNENSIELINFESEKTGSYKAFKKLITNIQFLCVNKIIDKKVMLVTSPEKEVGKSYVVANIATSFAEIGKKVLIIDADLENGRQDKIFNVPNNLGLSNYLSNIDSNGVEINEFLSKYINETAVKNVNLITSGIVPPNPAELLALPKFQELLKDAKVFFDIIIIDSAEVLERTEALLLAKEVNSTLIVVSQIKSSLESLSKAKKDIQNVGGNILGVILNEVKIKREKKTKKQRQEEFSKFKLKVKYKINETIEKIKKKLQDTNQKLLEEPKKEETEIKQEVSNIVEEKVENNKEEKNEILKQEKEDIVKEKNIKKYFVEILRNIRKSDKQEDKNKESKEEKSKKEITDIDNNQLSMFQEEKEKEEVKVEKDENQAEENTILFKEKVINLKNNVIEKLKTLKTNFSEKTKSIKEKTIVTYNKSKDFCINKFNNFKNKKLEKKESEEKETVIVEEKNDEKTDSTSEDQKNFEEPKVVVENLKDDSLINDKMVLVVVDAENGYCRVFSKDYFTEKLVRGFDKKARYIKAHYSKKNLKRKQEYFIDRYQITEAQSKTIDALIYDTLKDYDEYLWVERKMPSDKAENYALCISKEYEKESNETDKEFYIRCQRKRKFELEESNLEIVYKLDKIWKTNKINIFDKIQLNRFAKIYEIENSMKNDSEIQKNQKAKEFYDDIISGAERRLEKANKEDKKREETEKQVIEEDRKIKQEQLKLEQHQFEMEKRAAQERIKLEQENVKAEKRAEAERLKEEKRKEREIEKIEKKEENIRRKKEKQKQKEDAKFQKELEKVKQREEAKLEEELLVDNLYPKTKHNKNL